MKTYITPAAHIIELDSNHLLADSNNSTESTTRTMNVGGGPSIIDGNQILSNRRSQNGIWDDDL